MPTVDEAADYVHPVDRGDGTIEEPLASEDQGSYVSGAVHEHEHAPSADTVPMTMDEKGDYVTPVDHGAGTEVDADEESGEYVDAERDEK